MADLPPPPRIWIKILSWIRIRLRIRINTMRIHSPGLNCQKIVVDAAGYFVFLAVESLVDASSPKFFLPSAFSNFSWVLMKVSSDMSTRNLRFRSWGGRSAFRRPDVVHGFQLVFDELLAAFGHPVLLLFLASVRRLRSVGFGIIGEAHCFFGACGSCTVQTQTR